MARGMIGETVMSFELIDNLFQVFVLFTAMIVSLVMFVKYRDRLLVILAFAYACFCMGTLYYVLYLAIIGDVPQVFYVAEISWLASYLFYASVILLRLEKTKVGFSLPSLIMASLVIAAIILLRIFGPSYFMVILLALTVGGIVYLALYRIHRRMKFLQFDVCMLVCVALQIMLYGVSGFVKDYKVFNIYFMIDIMLTCAFVTLLPLIVREVRAK